MNDATITKVKEQVKRNTIMPFHARNITCAEKQLIINDRYTTTNTQTIVSIMNTLGIRKNLTDDIFINPDEYWSEVKSSLDKIDTDRSTNRIFNCIVDNENEIKNISQTSLLEPTELNFDNRIDKIIDTVANSNEQEVVDIVFYPLTSRVDISTINNDEVDCQLGDLWKFGTTVNISATSQAFKTYFNRLICTNGLTTKDNLAYRVSKDNDNIVSQFQKFSSSSSIRDIILPRVNNLCTTRASLFELKAVARKLTSEQRAEYLPEYERVKNDFTERGYDIDKMSSNAKLAYTDMNMYDLFNRATFLSTHKRKELSTDTALGLNTVASTFFSKGPLLRFNTIDIYQN